MKKEFRNVTAVFGIYLIIISSGLGFFGSADDFPEEEQILLVYDVLEWEEGPLGVEWTIWGSDYSSVYKGNFSSNVGGKFEILLTGFHEKNATYEFYDAIDEVSYGDISIFKKMEGNYELNFTLSNISMNEMGMILAYGFFGWNPAFNISADWGTNAGYALNRTDLGYGVVNASISTNSSIMVYDFKQMDGLGQTTTLVYNKSTGILLEAVTNVGSYKSHIRLQGYTPPQQIQDDIPPQQIPGYSISLVLISVLFGILVVYKKRSRKN